MTTRSSTRKATDTFIARFLDSLKTGAPELPEHSWEDVRSSVSARAAALTEQEAGRAIDPPSCRLLALSVQVLAAYGELAPVVGRSRAHALLQRSLVAPGKGAIAAHLTEWFGIMAEATPEQVFHAVAVNFKLRGEHRFGRTFIFAQEIQEQDHSQVNILKCFFNDFFRDQGAPELITLFCAMDDLWAEELKTPRYGVQFHRPTTLAKGDDACRFRFSKVQTGRPA